MDWRLGLRAAGWGFLAMLIASGPYVGALEEFPDPLGWLKLAAFLAAAFGGGCVTYMRKPNGGPLFTRGPSRPEGTE